MSGLGGTQRVSLGLSLRVWAVTLLTIGLMLGSISSLFIPFTIKGSLEHAPPIMVVLRGCTSDSEDAHPTGSNIRRRCERAAWLRVGIGLAGAAIGGLTLAITFTVFTNNRTTEIDE